MDPQHYKVDRQAMEHLEKRIAPAENKVIDGNMLKSCVEQEFNKNGFFVSKNSTFCDEFSYCIRTLMTEVEVELNPSSGNVAMDPDQRLKLVGLFGLIALHNRLFHNLDKRMLNKIWDLCKKVSFLFN